MKNPVIYFLFLYFKIQYEKKGYHPPIQYLSSTFNGVKKNKCCYAVKKVDKKEENKVSLRR